MMKNKLNILVIGILLIGIMFLIAGVGGVEDELTQLEQELEDAGYLWMINYNKIGGNLK